jgi:hypothetical protein
MTELGGEGASWLAWLDAGLIAPYRWLHDPVWAWWAGTLVLAGWATLLGGLTSSLARRANRAHLAGLEREMADRNAQAMAALAAGDKPAYKALNKDANEAFGKLFFLKAAMGAASLWPAFLAVAWLQSRFEGLAIPAPFTPWGIGYAPGFLICYLIVRLSIYWLKKLLLTKAQV